MSYATLFVVITLLLLWLNYRFERRRALFIAKMIRNERRLARHARQSGLQPPPPLDWMANAPAFMSKRMFNYHA